MANQSVHLAGNNRNRATWSPLFLLPLSLRLLIYEFIFSSALPPSLDRALSLPNSSANLEPLLTCRDLYREARLIAFACTTHNLNWTRSTSCLRRLRLLEPAQHTHIRHVALTTTASGLYAKLFPLRQHFDHVYAPHLSLESLSIILTIPEYKSLQDKERAVRELTMVLDSVYYFKNVERVVLVNVMHKDQLRYRPEILGEWICMDLGSPPMCVVEDGCGNACEIDVTRWQFDLTTFYDYNWKPWH